MEEEYEREGEGEFGHPHEKDGGHLSGGSAHMHVRGPVRTTGMQTPTPGALEPHESNPEFPHGAPGGFLEGETPTAGRGGKGEGWGGEPFEAHDDHHESFRGEHGGASATPEPDRAGIPHQLHKTGHPELSREAGRRGFINSVVQGLREGRGKRG